MQRPIDPVSHNDYLRRFQVDMRPQQYPLFQYHQDLAVKRFSQYLELHLRQVLSRQERQIRT